MNIAFLVSKRYVKLVLLKGATNEPKLRINFNVLRDDPEKRRLLTEKTEKQLELINIEENNVDLLNHNIVEAVRTSAEQVCPVQDDVTKKEPWEDRTLQDLNHKLKKAKNSQAIKRINKEIKDCRQKLKNEYFNQLADGINTVAEARQVDKEFSLVKKYTAIKTGVRTVISKEKLKTHFENPRAPERNEGKGCSGTKNVGIRP